MANEHFFTWRTAPRSITELIKWLPYFKKYETVDLFETVPNQNKVYTPNNANLKVNQRALLYDYVEDNVDTVNPLTKRVVQVAKEEFVNGIQAEGDKADKESMIRQRLTTAEQFGLMSAQGKLTEAGNRVVDGTFTGEDFLAQLLKLYITEKSGRGVFPMKMIIRAISENKSISRNEMAFVFGVLDDADIDNGMAALNEFRRRYDDRNEVPNKNSKKDVRALFHNVWQKYYDNKLSEKNIDTIWDADTDALGRALEFTDMFYSHGRGTAKRFRVSELNTKKFQLLADRFEFVKPPLTEDDGKQVQRGSRDTIAWYGAVGNISLPWDKPEERRELVQDKLAQATKLFADVPNGALSDARVAELTSDVPKASITQLKDIEVELDNKVLSHNEQRYVQVEAKTDEKRKEIIERFDIIQGKNKTVDNDMAALWLEVNTWRSFVALNGADKRVIHNFKMNPDLTPKSFAPGIGNTPDMEVYFDDTLILPEVSLMTGVQQWEHEASSVVEHVFRRIEKTPDRRVIGLFISSTMNVRTMWQFYLLNRESWIGQPVPVVPLTIGRFSDIMEFAYAHDADIVAVHELLQSFSEATAELPGYTAWQDEIDRLIEAWKDGFAVGV